MGIKDIKHTIKEKPALFPSSNVLPYKQLVQSSVNGHRSHDHNLSEAIVQRPLNYHWLTLMAYQGIHLSFDSYMLNLPPLMPGYLM